MLIGPAAFALQGNDNCYNPSTIIKQGNKYWVFTTGPDIYAMYSTDLVNRQLGPRSIFNGVQPSWIASRVPGFDHTIDTYWTPECVYRNGKYYLYYSCSKFSTNTSAIGLASMNGNRVVEVPACSATAGTQLALYDYLGNPCQQWGIGAAGSTAALMAAPTPATTAQVAPAEDDLSLRVYPHPAPKDML